MAFRKGKKRSKKTFRGKRKTRGKKLGKGMKKAIKKIVAGNIETKYAGHIIENHRLQHCYIGTADPTPILPEVPQGPEKEMRLGSDIRPTSCSVGGIISFDQSLTTYMTWRQPLRVRVLIISQHTIKQQSQLSSFASTQLLKVNDYAVGTEVKSFDGYTIDLLYPVNRDLFTVHYDKTFTLYPTYSNSVGNYPVAHGQSVKWHARVPLPKRLKFATNGDMLPNNSCPFLVTGWAYTDGTIIDGTQKPIASSTFVKLHYKDA